MSMQRKLKTALDATRMLMMGSQILFGFQLEAVFQKNFTSLDEGADGVRGAQALFASSSSRLAAARAGAGGASELARAPIVRSGSAALEARGSETGGKDASSGSHEPERAAGEPQ
jgi:hypothetical protein